MPSGSRRTATPPRSQTQADPSAEPRAPQTPAPTEPANGSPQGSENTPVASWSSYSQGGQIEVAVWENVGQDRSGKERATYSVTMTRSYKQDDGEYRRTKSLFSGDVPIAIVLLQVAMAWIIQNQARSA
jgi:hypothetical protein